jgi:ribosomal protein S18 acetylase RimI-like enzyme
MSRHLQQVPAYVLRRVDRRAPGKTEPDAMLPSMPTPGVGAAPALEIRPFAVADHAGVEALWAEAFPEDPSHNVSAKMIARKLTVQPELFLVAVQEGRVVGAVMAGFDGVRGWIHRLAVLESTRRRGVGKRLIEHAENGLHGLGCPKLNLQVRSTNASVIAFYRALGYAVEERISMGKRLE